MSELVNVAFKSFNSENIKYANSEKPKMCLNLLGGKKTDIYIYIYQTWNKKYGYFNDYWLVGMSYQDYISTIFFFILCLDKDMYCISQSKEVGIPKASLLW